ncbi:MAG: CPBP family glutamic-type intramembrane protease [Marinifilaceae bacterium]
MSIISNIIFPKQTDEYKDITINIFLKLYFVIELLNIVTGSIVTLFITKLPPATTINNLCYYQKFILIVILGPIIEEISFRLWLKKGKYNFQLSIAGALIVLVLMVHKTLSSNIIVLPVILSAIILVTSVIISKLKPMFFQKYYKYFTYISFFAFGFMHIGKYPDLASIHYYLYPIMVLPYISMGVILGYTRISYGIKYSILLHASINLLPTLFM